MPVDGLFAYEHQLLVKEVATVVGKWRGNKLIMHKSLCALNSTVTLQRNGQKKLGTLGVMSRLPCA